MSEKFEYTWLPREENMNFNSPFRGEWCREIEIEDLEIDWANMKRMDPRSRVRGEYDDPEERRTLAALKKKRLHEHELQQLIGWKTPDYALNEATFANIPQTRFMGPQKVATPEMRGIPKWEADPITNSKMIQRMLRALGALAVGFTKVEQGTTANYIYNYEGYDRDHRRAPREIVFEDVPVGYETDEKMVIPFNARYAIVFCVQMSGYGLAQAPTMLSKATTANAYQRLYTIYNTTHDILRYLGYHSYGADAFNQFAVFPAFAVLAGVGESSRLDIVQTPERGPMVRLGVLLTDMPLALTKPISYGLTEFCTHCRVCQECCFMNAISDKDEPSHEVLCKYNFYGKKGFHKYGDRCSITSMRTGSNCGYCFSKCPFACCSSQAERLQLLKDMNSKPYGSYPVPKFDRSVQDPEAWWAQPDADEFGIDTSHRVD